MEADDPQGLHAHGQKFLRGVKESQQRLGQKLESGQTHQHKAESGGTGDFQGEGHPFRLSGAVVKGDDGNGGVVDAEQGHEEEALQLIVDAEHAGGGFLEALENLVHAEVHHGADAVHDQRGDAHGQNGIHGFLPGPQIGQAQHHVRVPLDIEVDAGGRSDPLADDCGHSRTGDAHGGKPKSAVDEDGIQNDVDHRTGDLGDHGVHRSAGGLKQPLPQNLGKAADGEDAANADVGGAALHGFRHSGLHFKIGPGTEETKEHKQRHGDQRQQDAVSGSVVGGLLVFLPQAFGQQGVDAHRNTHGEADLHILHRESQGQGGDGAFGHLRYIDAVHHIVKRLNHHGDDHGQGHVIEQLPNGHDPHFVFLDGSRLGSGCVTCHFPFYLSLNNKISIIL